MSIFFVLRDQEYYWFLNTENVNKKPSQKKKKKKLI